MKFRNAFRKYRLPLTAFSGGLVVLAPALSHADVAADITAAIADGKSNLTLAAGGLITIVAVLVAFNLIFALLKK